MSKLLPGENIFKKLNAKYKKKRKGSIIAIDPKTGNYLMGKDELEVALEGKLKFPGVAFSVFRIGYEAVHKFKVQRS